MKLPETPAEYRAAKDELTTLFLAQLQKAESIEDCQRLAMLAFRRLLDIVCPEEGR